jgi:plastocyanin
MKHSLRSRSSLATLSVGLLIAALAAVGSASAAPKTLIGTVGPDPKISLKLSGQKVTKLKPATYRFKIRDRAPVHNFRLRGPGYNKAITSVGFEGTKTVTIKLRKGTYRYVCDPHASQMKGSFKVG